MRGQQRGLEVYTAPVFDLPCRSEPQPIEIQKRPAALALGTPPFAAFSGVEIPWHLAPMVAFLARENYRPIAFPGFPVFLAFWG